MTPSNNPISTASKVSSYLGAKIQSKWDRKEDRLSLDIIISKDNANYNQIYTIMGASVTEAGFSVISTGLLDINEYGRYSVVWWLKPVHEDAVVLAAAYRKDAGY